MATPPSHVRDQARTLASAPSSEDPSRSGHAHRLTALDGLRGVAALVVVFYHTAMASSLNLADTYLGNASLPTGSADWFFSRTPLHVFWDGQEVVQIFFVLSGFVLALPAVTRGTQWFSVSYYPRRIIRLYFPAIGALLFGGLLHQLHTKPIVGASWWLNDHAISLTAHDALNDATLVHQGSLWAFTSVVWSLKYEVIFSLALPVVLWLALIVRRAGLLSLLVAAGCLYTTYAATKAGNNNLYCYPVFALGVLMAFHADRLRRLALPWMLPIALSLCVFLLTTAYIWTGVSETVNAIQRTGVVVASCLAVWIAIGFERARKMLSGVPAKWLGSRSYSLYLVHEPIVVATVFLFHGFVNPLLMLGVVVPISLLAAELFWRGVESPSIRLARRVGQTTRLEWLTLRSIRQRWSSDQA